jgi:chemotaxis protein MotB
MERKLTRLSASLGLLLSASILITGCGYSEDEWQAQLDKYNQLASKQKATEDELEAEKARVAALEKELEALGYRLGSEKQKLEEALEEYRARAAALERIKGRLEALRKKLEELTKLGLSIQIRKNRMVISLPGDVLFASGKDELEAKGKEILGLVAKAIREDEDLSKRTYQVAGHTDNEKISSVVTKNKFKDNWGLSLMRARTVLLFLVTPTDDEKNPGGGLDESLWSASGYGETDPIASNDDPEGRSKNRRVELIMMPNVEEMLDLKSLVDSAEAETEPVPAAAKKAAPTKETTTPSKATQSTPSKATQPAPTKATEPAPSKTTQPAPSKATEPAKK